MPITYDSFDFIGGNIEEICDLRRRVYGTYENWLARFHWEYIENPLRERIDVLVAREDGRMVGCTSRLPFSLLLDGAEVSAHFSVNSLVDPSCQGKGVMRNLYELSFERHPILFSKNTTDNMYKLLIKMGYTPIEPNNYMVKILRPIRWIASKTFMGKRLIRPPARMKLFAVDGVAPVDGFGEDFDLFWSAISSRLDGAPVRSSAFMNWRYLKIPHKKYWCFRRAENGKQTSVFVLRAEGRTGYLADMVWDRANSREPLASVSAAMKILARAGMVKVICWCTNGNLRNVLKQCGFYNSPDTPRFSVRAKGGTERFEDGTKLHFVAGDGDGDYL